MAAADFQREDADARAGVAGALPWLIGEAAALDGAPFEVDDRPVDPGGVDGAAGAPGRAGPSLASP